MHIGIDGNEANIQNRVGIGQFAYKLLSHLNVINRQHYFTIYLKNPPLPDMPPPSPKWRYLVFGPKNFWTRIALPLHLIYGKRPDIFFSPSHYTPFFSPVPTICSIMDLGFLYYPQQFTPKDLYQLTHWTKESVKKSKHIFTISEFSKNEIIKHYHVDPSHITIIYPGVEVPEFDRSNPYPKTNYFLSLGTLKPSKNIPFLITSFAAFVKKCPDYKLIICGKRGWIFEQIFTTVKQLNLENKVIFQDYITEDQKWSLIKNAKALIIPSLYEGFGIPAIEAMALGTPVISSNVASLPEIVKGYGILIDPLKLDTLTTAMFEVIKPDNAAKLSKLGRTRSANFTWNQAAKTFLNTLNKL